MWQGNNSASVLFINLQLLEVQQQMAEDLETLQLGTNLVSHFHDIPPFI